MLKQYCNLYIFISYIRPVHVWEWRTKDVMYTLNLFVCLFVRQTREFSTHLETPSLPVKGCKILTYDRHSGGCWALTSLQCHTNCPSQRPTVYNGHLKYVTWTPVAERLAVELWICPDWGSNPDHLHAMRTVYHCTPATIIHVN